MKRILPIFVLATLSLRVLAVARADTGYGYSYSYDLYYGTYPSDAGRIDTYYNSPDGGYDSYYWDNTDTGSPSAVDLALQEEDTGAANFGRAEGGCSAAGLLGGWASFGLVAAMMATWLQARRPGGAAAAER